MLILWNGYATTYSTLIRWAVCTSALVERSSLSPGSDALRGLRGVSNVTELPDYASQAHNLTIHSNSLQFRAMQQRYNNLTEVKEIFT